MPHINIKLAPGRTEEQKQRLTAQIVKDLVDIAGAEEAEVSVAIEEVLPADWTERVYKLDILPQWAALYKVPGYQP
jgi:4-oxalocrotonate tautomerase